MWATKYYHGIYRVNTRRSWFQEEKSVSSSTMGMMSNTWRSSLQSEKNHPFSVAVPCINHFVITSSCLVPTEAESTSF